MDGICIWLERLLTWIDRNGAPTLAYVGQPEGGYFNPPAPHIGLTWLRRGRIDDLSVGPMRVHIPGGHLAAHSVHLGNKTPRIQRTDAWVAYFDVTAAPAFLPLKRTPWFDCLPVGDADAMEAAFSRLHLACTRHGNGQATYLGEESAYAPSRDPQASPTAPFHVKIAALDLVLQFYDQALLHQRRPRPASVTPVSRAIAWMEHRLADHRLDLSAIAAAAMVTPTHLGRLFRQSVGRTPMRHLQHLRIESARLRLAAGDEPVARIAAAVGMPDQFHFSRVFRRLCGSSPSAYRLAAQQGRDDGLRACEGTPTEEPAGIGERMPGRRSGAIAALSRAESDAADATEAGWIRRAGVSSQALRRSDRPASPDARSDAAERSRDPAWRR